MILTSTFHILETDSFKNKEINWYVMYTSSIAQLMVVTIYILESIFFFSSSSVVVKCDRAQLLKASCSSFILFSFSVGIVLIVSSLYEFATKMRSTFVSLSWKERERGTLA